MTADGDETRHHDTASTDGRRTLRIAQVLPVLDTGGMEVMALGLARELRRRGHDTTIVCTEALGTLVPRAEAASVPMALVPAPGLASVVRPDVLAAWLRSHRIDVVHSHSGVCAKASRAARMAGVPAIVHTRHGVQVPLSWSDTAFIMLGALQTHVTVGCSVDVVEYFRAHMSGRRADVVLVENGMDVESFLAPTAQGSLRAEFHIPADAFVLGTVARLHPVKNQQLMVEALALLGEPWHLVLVGDGPLRDALAAQAAARGVAQRVHFAGTRSVNAALYRSFDVFALSSLSEAMPMTVLEAFAARVPVVAPAVGGLPSLLEDGRLGRLYPSGDVAGFSRVIAATMQDESRSARQVGDAWQSMCTVHSVEAMTTAYEAIYQRLVARNSPRS